MEYFICTVPVMPLRQSPSDRSEMSSQLLFGEAAMLLQSGPEGWVYIQNQFDGYKGWAATNQLTPIAEELYQQPTNAYTSEPISTISVSGHSMRLPMGSFLKGIQKNGKLQWGKILLHYKGDSFLPAKEEITEKRIKEMAFLYLNTPYFWGGRSNYGIDCSGFTQSVFRLLGRVLPRDASQQAVCGNPLNKAEEWQCGDLAFFHNDRKKITHVGLVLNASEISHASGKVRIDKLDTTGIQNVDTGRYSHQLAMIRRFF